VSSGLNVEPELSLGTTAPVAGNSSAVSVAEGYARWAPIYDYDANPLLACEERYLLPLLPDLHHKRVLDLACGTGRWLERFMTQGGGSGVGIDCSVAMLQVAGHKAATTGRLARAVCENLPFCDEAFDLAICSFALGHIRDLQAMVSELARVTKPGANVFVSDLHPEAYAQGWRVGFRDGRTAIQIETQSRAAKEIVHEFHANGFEGFAPVPLYLGDTEKPIFMKAGKTHSFEAACQLPAVLLCHFKRMDTPLGFQRAG